MPVKLPEGFSGEYGYKKYILHYGGTSVHIHNKFDEGRAWMVDGFSCPTIQQAVDFAVVRILDKTITIKSGFQSGKTNLTKARSRHVQHNRNGMDICLPYPADVLAAIAEKYAPPTPIASRLLPIEQIRSQWLPLCVGMKYARCSARCIEERKPRPLPMCTYLPYKRIKDSVAGTIMGMLRSGEIWIGKRR